MKFLNKRMVLVINRMAFELSGGASTSGTNLRAGASLGFVDQIHSNSIFGTPIYPDIYHQAAAYMFHIVKSHIFMDGNKRTGLATAITFLAINKIVFAPLEEDKVFDFVMTIAAGKNDGDTVVPIIAKWLKKMSL